MKKLFFFAFTALLLRGMVPGVAAFPEEKNPDDRIQVACSPDLKTLVKECIDSYKENGGQSAIEFVYIDPSQAGEWLLEPGHIGLFSKNGMSELEPQNFDVFVIGRAVYVPVMNPANPLKDTILLHGISPREFSLLYSIEGETTWGALIGTGDHLPAIGYRTSDSDFSEYLASFTDPFSAKGGKVSGTCAEVLASVENDPFGIGFCKLSQLSKIEEAGLPLNVLLVPLDLNDNNRVDHFESIYSSLATLNRGIWIGKYANSLYSRIFVVSAHSKTSVAGREFLIWLIGSGNSVLEESGYSGLNDYEQKTMLARLQDIPLTITPAIKHSNRSAVLMLFLAIFLIAALSIYFVIRQRKTKRSHLKTEEISPSLQQSGQSIPIPEGYYFDRSHTWAFQEKDGTIRIGLDSFITVLTGPLSRVEIRNPGTHIRRGQPLFSILRNGKRLEILSPISGNINAVNERLQTEPKFVNEFPYEDGWVYTVQPTSWTEEITHYLRAPKYREWIGREMGRLKDFLATRSHAGKNMIPVMQEGGDFLEGVLGELGPDAWNDFQSQFLNNINSNINS